MRDHAPVTIEDFNGLWARGDAEACPPDHFLAADNLQYIQSGFKTRDPIDKYQDSLPITGVLRVYTYTMQSGESLLVLTTGGNIYHVIGPSLVYGPILTIPGMTDFGFTAIAGRAYITPFASSVNSLGFNSEVGLQNDYVYVYKGDGTHARKAAGFPPTNGGARAFTAYPISIAGVVTEGTHVVAVAYTDGNIGLLGPEKFIALQCPADGQIQLNNIPIGPVGTTGRIIAMTKAVDMVVVTNTESKTYDWAANIDGWVDRKPTQIPFTYEGTDHAVKFANTISPDNDIFGEGASPIATSWESLGVPAGATVVGVQITGIKRKVISNTNSILSHLIATMESQGADICNGNALLGAAIPNSADGAYTAMTPGVYIAVNSTYAPSNTVIRLVLNLEIQAHPALASVVDIRFDDVVLVITYQQQVEALFQGDQTTFTYYDVLTINDNVTTDAKVNIDDASMVTVHTPGGTPPAAPITNSLLVQQVDKPGTCDLGIHLIGVVYETDTGYLTAPGPEYFGVQTYIDETKTIKISGIPLSTDPAVVKRHLVSTIAIPNYNGNQRGYQFYFIPDATLNDNTTTELEVSYFDADLLSDASHLFDNYSEIPAFVGLTTYKGRMVGYGEYGNISVARLSAPGEPEAISQVDGLIITPLDGYPITNAQEYRDTLYLFKRSKTMAYNDNGDVPPSWPINVIDQGAGASVHGIATVLDSGGINIDFLIIANYSGIMMFNGVFSRPELSWKIADLWSSFNKNDYRYIQAANDSINKKLWITLPPPYQNQVIHLDYANGLDPQNVRFAVWKFSRAIQSVTLVDVNKLILGGDGILFLNTNKLEKHDSYYDREEAIPMPRFRTAYDKGAAGDNIMHYTAIRMRVNGTGNLKLRAFSLDDVHSENLVSLPMANLTDVIPTRLCNFTSQRASLEGWTSEFNEVFKINHITIFVKEVAASYPG